MNVLHLISSGGYYGAENVVVSLAESLEAQGCQSVIGVFHNQRQRNEEFIRQAERRDLMVVPIPCRGRWDRQTVLEIRKTLDSKSVDILHTHGYKPDIYGYLAARNRAIPLIATCHNWTRDTAAVRIYEFLDSLFLRAFDAVVVVSEAMAMTLHSAGIHESKIRVVDNGIDFASFSRARTNPPKNVPGGKFVVGTAGRLVPLKGLDNFLLAAREILTELADVTFVIIGSGPEREKLGSMAQKLGIEKNVVFTGHCAEMAAAYASMDVFVLASNVEAMPMVVLEALASRKAVVATSVGAIPRLIIPEKTGLLVPPQNVQALTRAILRLLNDSSFRTRLGIEGAALVERNHSHETMARNYSQLYQQVALRESRQRHHSAPKKLFETQ
jgi:glycosyltransferase involved in cell wall biosynthesis